MSDFTCGHCDTDVPRALADQGGIARNHCPSCLYSKHVEFGEESGYPPCGSLMKGSDVGDGQVVWRCLGCGFMMRGPTDDYIFRAVSDGLGSVGYVTFYGGGKSSSDIVG